uniref:Chemosensory protein 30 n=1 Tax=Heliconius charithonia TaxID=33434 RepID=A0AA49FSS8_HELCH|nr:chemosensory protein 30 [Heliconius charithonia]
MKIILVFAFVATVAAVEFYTTGNDRLDMDALIADKYRLQEYVDCFLERKSCTELTTTYKAILSEAVKEACRKCNPNQRHQFWRFLEGLKVVLPEEYMNFRHFYDPEDKYFDSLEKEISRYHTRDMDLLD